MCHKSKVAAISRTGLQQTIQVCLLISIFSQHSILLIFIFDLAGVSLHDICLHDISTFKVYSEIIIHTCILQ